MNIISAAWVSEIRSIQRVSLLYCIYTEFVLCSGVDMISQSNTGGAAVYCARPFPKGSEILASPGV